MNVVQERTLSGTIRALDVLPSDYHDVFTAIARDAARTSPERWARVALEGISPLGRFLAWRMLLGLRLEPRPSPDHLAGWRIVDRGDDWIRMESDSWFLTANVIFHVDEDHVSFATLIRYDRPIARLVWTPVSAIHRRLAPGVVRSAVRRVARGSR